jgi:hypothetical protein
MVTDPSHVYRASDFAAASRGPRRLRFKDFAADPRYLCAQTTARGGEWFNFPQAITLHPGVFMRTRADWGPELETLAVNLLLQSKPAWRSMKDAVLARRVTRPFAEAIAIELLAPSAGHTWVLTTEAVMDALTHLSSRKPAR